jgi:adenylate kinase family enzyme
MTYEVYMPCADRHNPGLRNFLIVGLPGSGKSTLAKRITAIVELTYIDVDTLKHGAGWTVRDSFVADVEEATKGTAWIADSASYPQVADFLWAGADTVVFLDLPLGVVLARLLRRTIRRQLRRETLAHGNRETLRRVFSRQHPIAKVLLNHASRRVETLDRGRSHMGEFIHITSVRESESLLADMAAQARVRARGCAGSNGRGDG